MPDYKLTDVDTVRITNAVNGISDDIKGLNAIGAEIKNNIVPPLDQHWQGQAKQNFDSRIALFPAEYSQIVEGYNQLNEQLRETGKIYESADDSVKQLIGKLSK